PPLPSPLSYTTLFRSWNGSMVYPLYSDRIGAEPILLYMTLLSQAPPAGLRGHGLGLAVRQGYIDLDGHKLTGVDIWSDALARGVDRKSTRLNSSHVKI